MRDLVLDRELKESTDRILEACDKAEVERTHVVKGRFLEPHAYHGEKLVFRRCDIRELTQWDVVIVELATTHRHSPCSFLAYVGVVSDSGDWFFCNNSNPEGLRSMHPATLWRCDIACLWKAVRTVR